MFSTKFSRQMTTLNQKSSKMNGSLTTEPDSFSDEAWSLLLIAEQSARRWRHKNLDVEHLIEVLFRNKKYQKVKIDQAFWFCGNFLF